MKIFNYKKHLAWNVFLHCYFSHRGFSPGETKENMWCVLMWACNAEKRLDIVLLLFLLCIFVFCWTAVCKEKNNSYNEKEAVLFFRTLFSGIFLLLYLIPYKQKEWQRDRMLQPQNNMKHYIKYYNEATCKVFYIVFLVPMKK